MIVTTDSIGPGIRFDLYMTYELSITEGVTVQSTNSMAIYGEYDGYSVDILGTVSTLNPDTFAIVLGQSKVAHANNNVTVQASGEVDGGVLLLSKASSVTNHGAIVGSVCFGGISLTGQSTLTNDGTIAADSAIYRAIDSTETLVINNSGTITGTAAAITGSDTWSSEIIVNTGHIQGSIYLNWGNDSYDGSNGAFVGDIIDGGAGDDSLLGGILDEVFGGAEGYDTIDGGGGRDLVVGAQGYDTLSGGAGTDDITGGLDRDILSGGEGNDLFIYTTQADSRKTGKDVDLITDFSRLDGDMINLALVDANGREKRNGTFEFIGKKEFHGDNGELRYQSSNGHTFLYGDVNGDRKADFAIEFDDVIRFRAMDFML